MTGKSTFQPLVKAITLATGTTQVERFAPLVKGDLVTQLNLTLGLSAAIGSVPVDSPFRLQLVASNQPLPDSLSGALSDYGLVVFNVLLPVRGDAIASPNFAVSVGGSFPLFLSIGPEYQHLALVFQTGDDFGSNAFWGTASLRMFRQGFGNALKE